MFTKESVSFLVYAIPVMIATLLLGFSLEIVLERRKKGASVGLCVAAYVITNGVFTAPMVFSAYLLLSSMYQTLSK